MIYPNVPGGTQGPNIVPLLLAVVCCLPRSCPGVPSLSVSLLLFSATPRSFGSASATLPLWLPSKGNSTVAVHFFPQDMSNPAPSLRSHLFTHYICFCHFHNLLNLILSSPFVMLSLSRKTNTTTAKYCPIAFIRTVTHHGFHLQT